ncbi:sperm-associated antigen 17-like, partial [Rhinophrynus dorsalis]
PSLIKMKLLKDGHSFLIHITNPTNPTQNEQEELVRSDQQGLSKKRSVSEFGSFSASLESGIQLSVSHYGASGKSPEEKDPELAAMLAFPSVHTPSIMPTPPPVPASPPSGKARKSPRQKSPRASRVKTPQPPPPVEETPRPPEVKVEPVQSPVPPPPDPGPTGPVFQSLNMSCPNGLLLTFLREDSSGHSGLEQREGRETEAADASQRLLVRQSYPVRLRNAQLCRSKRNPRAQEASRVITAQGVVIKHLLDGSTQVLFPDGTVSRSPDSGPIVQPPTTSVTSSTGHRDSKEQRHESAPETKKEKEAIKTAAQTVKPETQHQDLPAREPSPTVRNVPEVKPGTWITTTPSGEQIGTRGSQRLELKPLMSFKATDPVNGTVMTTREDRVVTVLKKDGTRIVEHEDGTRITTFYQDTEVSLLGDDEETGTTAWVWKSSETSQTITKRGEFIRVESEDYATVVLSCEDNVCYAMFGDCTEVLAKPQGMYQVYPPMSGCLTINQDGCAVYSPVTSSSTRMPLPEDDLSPGSYILSHTGDVICEVLDPEGNLFQVLVNGSTSVHISSHVMCEEEEHDGKDTSPETFTPDNSKAHTPEVYDLHTPRFFIVGADGSGGEILRNREVEDFLASCYCDPATAVLREPAQELSGIQSITVLKPFPETSPWVRKKELNNIVPPNLVSRSWDNFPSLERKTPGPGLGIGEWKGLQIGARKVIRPRPPVLRCPNALQIRQLVRYGAITPDQREGLQCSLKEYIERVLKKESELKENDIKDPRTEKENSADLLKLVLAFPNTRESSRVPSLERIKDDIANVYKRAVVPVPEPPPPGALPERSAEDWERIRLEIQEQKETLLAIRNHHIPPYFQSEMGRTFLQTQIPDMDHLSRQLPPFPKVREGDDKIDADSTISSEDPGAASEPENGEMLSVPKDTTKASQDSNVQHPNNESVKEPKPDKETLPSA